MSNVDLIIDLLNDYEFAVIDCGKDVPPLDDFMLRLQVPGDERTMETFGRLETYFEGLRDNEDEYMALFNELLALKRRADAKQRKQRTN